MPGLGASAGSGENEARRWSQRQRPCPLDALLRTAALVVEKLHADRRIDALQGESGQLSDEIASTYEEISFLHRLTQNLRISSKADDLGRLALTWLMEVMDVEGLALQWVSPPSGESVAPGTHEEQTLLTAGSCPVGGSELAELVEHLGLTAAGDPFVANRATSQEPWPLDSARQLVIVPLTEGGKLLGWLAAFDHAGDEEFGTDEASLMSSVGTILGIHSGNLELYRQQSEFLAGVIRALTSAIDAKDPYTCGHSDRVARVAVRLGQELGLGSDVLQTIYLGGLLHDIGKIGIDDAVLCKPGKLTPEEFEHIKLHPEIGYNILVDIKKLGPMLPLVRHHHESWDGSGYPQGLAGDAIPYLARVAAVADAFDAMGSDRPYRRGMDDEKIDAVLRGGAGSQWDPEVVAAFFAAREDIRAIATEPQDKLPEPLEGDGEISLWP